MSGQEVKYWAKNWVDKNVKYVAGVDPYLINPGKADRNDFLATVHTPSVFPNDYGKKLVAEYINRPEGRDELIDKDLLKEMQEVGKYYQTSPKVFTSDKVRLTLQKFNLAPHYIDSIINALENE